ncbi:cupin [Engelhardtia mirabilis]
MPIDEHFHGEVVLPAGDLDASLAFFTGELGFALDTIFPADAPRSAILVGHGLRLRLERDFDGAAGTLRLRCAPGAARRTVAPGGTVVELVEVREPAPPRLAPRVQIHRAAGDDWGRGRAGMAYRDLLPGRLGGGLIASQIRIAQGGPVPDYVHFHEIAFQMIYCRRGWVRVAYEDQGEPFVMQAGDAVLQPPRIRHRVLESGDGLEVIELTCPAEHPTRADRSLELPTDELDPERDFGGQRFARHLAADSTLQAWRGGAFAARDLGLGAATGDVVQAVVARSTGAATPSAASDRHTFLFVLAGSAELLLDGSGHETLSEDDAVSLPPGCVHRVVATAPDLELLEVRLAVDGDGTLRPPRP